MKRFWLVLVLLGLLLCGALYVFAFGWSALPSPAIAVLWGALAVALFVIANEMRRPHFEEYNRKKALLPKIPEKYLAEKPLSGSVIFGKDYHTKKFVVAEPGSHTLIVGSTGSGKTATCLLPSILNHDTGSAFVVDIKSRELVVKSCDIHDPNTIIVDLDHRAPYVHGWDILYGLKRDGTDTEQDVLKVIREVAGIIIPKAESGDQFWNDSAKALFTGLAIFEIVYQQNYEFVNVVQSMMNIPLRDHLDLALNTVPKTSLVASYLTGLANTADETLFSCDISMCQHLYFFVSDEAAFALRDNIHRANPKLLNKDGTRVYLCISEEQLDCGFDRITNIVIKQVLQELQSRTTNGEYPQCVLFLDEWQRLSESVEELRKATASFLKTGRSKHASVVLCAQNLDGFDKSTIYDILSNVHYFYVLSSNNANSLTSEVACKMAGVYYEKTVSTSEGRGTSTSTSFAEKPVLRPDDLNNLGEDAVLIISNLGYVRTRKSGSAYFRVEPFKSKYEKIFAVNKMAMGDV